MPARHARLGAGSPRSQRKQTATAGSRIEDLRAELLHRGFPQRLVVDADRPQDRTIRLDRSRTDPRSTEHRRHGDRGGPGRPKRLPNLSIDLRQGQQEVLATDPMLAVDRLLRDAQAARDVLPRPSGPAGLFHLCRFELLDESA